MECVLPVDKSGDVVVSAVHSNLNKNLNNGAEAHSLDAVSRYVCLQESVEHLQNLLFPCCYNGNFAVLYFSEITFKYHNLNIIQRPYEDTLSCILAFV